MASLRSILTHTTFVLLFIHITSRATVSASREKLLTANIKSNFDMKELAKYAVEKQNKRQKHAVQSSKVLVFEKLLGSGSQEGEKFVNLDLVASTNGGSSRQNYHAVVQVWPELDLISWNPKQKHSL